MEERLQKILARAGLGSRRSCEGIIADGRVSVNGQTGVEMEALTAVSTAALTIYDMCKSYDKAMKISDIYLKLKSGGKSGTYIAK